MKITSDEIIRNGEQELIDAINADLDWEVMEDIFQKEHKLALGEDVEYKKGNFLHETSILREKRSYRLRVSPPSPKRATWLSLRFPADAILRAVLDGFVDRLLRIGLQLTNLDVSGVV